MDKINIFSHAEYRPRNMSNNIPFDYMPINRKGYGENELLGFCVNRVNNWLGIQPMVYTLYANKNEPNKYNFKKRALQKFEINNYSNTRNSFKNIIPKDIYGSIHNNSIQTEESFWGYLKDLKLLDVNGDGKTDILYNNGHISTNARICIECGPRGLKDCDNNTISINNNTHFANLSGNGLPDIVQITENNKIEYRFSLGNGLWSSSFMFKPYGYNYKDIFLDNKGLIKHKDPTDSRLVNIVFADLIGNGCSDMIILDYNEPFRDDDIKKKYEERRDGVLKISIWLNHNGNLSQKPLYKEISIPPVEYDEDFYSVTLGGGGGILDNGNHRPSWSYQFQKITFNDLLGLGTKGVFVQRRTTESFFISLGLGEKPYLLQEMKNNIGSVTEISRSEEHTSELQSR